jgi:DNA-binding transcriptional LysR family regulator
VGPGFIFIITSIIHLISSEIGPSFKVQLDFGERDALIKDVIDSKLDLAIVPDLDSPNDKLSHVRLSDRINLIFYASPNHPVFQKKQIEWQDICHFTLILDSAAAYFIKQKIIDKLTKEGIHTPNMITNNLEVCKKLVLDGEGIGIVFIEDIEDEIKAGSLNILSLLEDFRITVDAVFNKNFNTSPLILKFIDCAKIEFHNRDKRVSKTITKLNINN